jgi:hypothetical protein
MAKMSGKGYKILVISIIFLLAFGIIFYRPFGDNVYIEVISGAGGMPPGQTDGEILKGESFTVGVTTPFPTLERWSEAKVLKEITFSDGTAKIHLKPGKYGVYYVYNGQKQLYGNLTLANPRNDIQRDKQGPWYVQVNPYIHTKLKFGVNGQPQ